MQNEIYSNKLKTVCNAVIQIGDIDDTGKGRHFVSKFIQDGLVKIEGHGIVLLKKETIDQSLQSMVGAPVIIKHQDVTNENADDLRCGVISKAYFNDFDGWYYCEGIIWDEKAKELVNNGWSVSCSYDFLAYNDEGGVENNIKYDKEFTQLNFTHLALVDNPRYERANIVFNSKDKKGKWITIKGNHIFIPDGKTLDEVIKEKGWGDKENKQSDTINKHGFKKDKDSGYYMKDLSDGTSVYVEKKEGGQGEKEPFYLEATHFDKDGKTIAKKQYHYDSMDGMFAKIDKDFVSKDKQSDTKDNKTGEKIELRKDRVETCIKKGLEKMFYKTPRMEVQETSNGVSVEVTCDDWDARDIASANTLKKMVKDWGFEDVDIKGGKYKDNWAKSTIFWLDITRKNKANNSKEQEMKILDELKKLISKVENEKGEQDMDEKEKVDNENVDKRKLIDEVAGIMKSAGCDDEDIRTAIGKMEKIGYDKSEAGSADNKKVKNEEPDKKEDVDNEKDEEEKKDDKIDNEDEEDKKEVKEVKEEVKEDVDNKCKNSKSSFDKINEIYNSVKQIEKETGYVSRQQKLDNAVEYFK